MRSSSLDAANKFCFIRSRPNTYPLLVLFRNLLP